MVPIYLKTIVAAEEEIQNLDDAGFQEKLKTIEKRQSSLDAYISAAIESFEDEEEFADKFIFYVLVIHQSFSAVKRFLPTISPDIIKNIEEEEIIFFDKLDQMSDEEGEIAIDAKIANHPQRHLLRYLQAELNEDDEETDDHIEELNIHIFWLLSAITAMYDKALEISGFDPEDGRDGMDIREKKELREKKKLQKKDSKPKVLKSGHDKKSFHDEAAFEDRPKRDSYEKPKFERKFDDRSKHDDFKPKQDRPYEDRPKHDDFKPKQDRPYEDRPKRDDYKPKQDRPFEDRPKRESFPTEKPKLVKKSDLPARPANSYNDRPKTDRPYEDRPKRDSFSSDKPKFDKNKNPKKEGRDEYFKPKF